MFLRWHHALEGVARVDEFGAVDAAHAEFRRRLCAVTDEQWGSSTPCDEWSVRDLVNHVVACAHMYVRLLEGCSREEAAKLLVAEVLTDNPVAAFDAGAVAVCQAFRRPGVLDRVCEHPGGDVTGETLMGYRTFDASIHAWDLARAVGGDENLNDELVRRLWTMMEVLLAAGRQIGPGQSGTVDESHPLLIRLLDAAGRRP
ncbi:MAG: hypothetical protein QOJ19_3745 [Acidimicrobiia bacterium]|jgi:uncharacterized protein (TIGR03086 family)|nr:hypothetical protein [Acidimicrobiia bacterium]